VGRVLVMAVILLVVAVVAWWLFVRSG
jgi:hypothetical protein